MIFRLILFAAAILVSSNLFAEDYTKLAEQFFMAVRNNNKGEAEKTVKVLAVIPEDKLKEHLNTEHKAKAFWINIYNAYVQYLLKGNPQLFDDRDNFFTQPRIDLAGQKLSLDDIEHGIIRSSKNKYSMGYFGRFLVTEFEKKFRLERVDYRVHFALNCGAKSCPPIALYKAEKLEEQLNRSTALYLNKVSKYDAREDEVFVPALCSWFKADFGGEEGVIKIMKDFGVVPAHRNPDVTYLDYDWTLSLSNYIDL